MKIPPKRKKVSTQSKTNGVELAINALLLSKQEDNGVLCQARVLGFIVSNGGGKAGHFIHCSALGAKAVQIFVDDGSLTRCCSSSRGEKRRFVTVTKSLLPFH